jgi:membrane-associated protease RseP (regulator of RpoE activity)
MRLAKLNTLVEVMEIRRVKVFVHWSVLVIGAVILAGTIEQPLLAFSMVASYYGVILIHECGHMFAAQRKGYAVWSIELYPIWGITRFSEPYADYDRCVIAWGGVLAQLVVAIPPLIWLEIFGYTRFQPLNMVMTIFGGFSVFVAVFNLLPIRPLDGSIAWTLLPSLWRRRRAKATRREPGWRSWR